jgi:hypothetical protein
LLFINPLNFLTMDKFLSIPVSGASNALVSVADVLSITRSSSTESVINYLSGNTATITLGSAEGATNEFRDSLQEAMIEALATSWTDVVFPYAFSKDISGIVIA